MRFDLDVIQPYIKYKSRILDLGCGDGNLLQRLQNDKRVTGYGIEIDHDHITSCIKRGVDVIEKNIDDGLSTFEDRSFDTVIMTQAIQAMQRPDIVVEEMLRVGKECIITFPNFGHWKARCHLFFTGRMPVSDLLPYEWYNTPNIHFCTFRDFDLLCAERKITILNRQVVAQDGFSRLMNKWLPNWFGETAIYHLSK